MNFPGFRFYLLFDVIEPHFRSLARDHGRRLYKMPSTEYCTYIGTVFVKTITLATTTTTIRFEAMLKVIACSMHRTCPLVEKPSSLTTNPQTRQVNTKSETRRGGGGTCQGRRSTRRQVAPKIGIKSSDKYPAVLTLTMFFERSSHHYGGHGGERILPTFRVHGHVKNEKCADQPQHQLYHRQY